MITAQKPTEARETGQEAPAVTPVYTNPHARVERVDALDCQAPAAYRVGSRMVCDTHRLEVVRAFWECDASLSVLEVDETAGYRCGETFPAVAR